MTKGKFILPKIKCKGDEPSDHENVLKTKLRVIKAHMDTSVTDVTL